MKQTGAELCQLICLEYQLGYNLIQIGLELNYSGWWLAGKKKKKNKNNPHLISYWRGCPSVLEICVRTY